VNGLEHLISLESLQFATESMSHDMPGKTAECIWFLLFKNLPTLFVAPKFRQDSVCTALYTKISNSDIVVHQKYKFLLFYAQMCAKLHGASHNAMHNIYILECILFLTTLNTIFRGPGTVDSRH
jgi:hypothetical protein